MTVEIAQIRKNRREQLRVSVDRWRGVDLLNLRVWFLADDGSWRLGRQGVALRLELLEELVAALDLAALVDVEAEGDRA